MAERLDLHGQTPRTQGIINSFWRLGQGLVRDQVHFTVVDHEFLAGATIGKPSRQPELMIQGHAFRTLVLPADVELPPAAANLVAQFEKQGGKVLRDTRQGGFRAAPSRLRFTPNTDLSRARKTSCSVALSATAGPFCFW